MKRPTDMKGTPFVRGLLCICVGILLGGSSPADLALVRDTVTAIQAKIVQGFETGSIEPAKEYVANDWQMFMTTERRSIRFGKEQLLNNIKRYFTPAGNVKVAVDSSEWLITPIMSVYKAHTTVDFGLLTTQTRRVPFFITWIFENRNGRWYWVHAHESYAPLDSLRR